MHKHLYISILLILSVLSVTAQTNLHEEVLLHTDSTALYRQRCQEILKTRINKRMYDDLLEVIDFYNKTAKSFISNQIKSKSASEIDKYPYPQLVSTNALLGICLLNGDYDRFFSTLTKFPIYIYDDNSAMRWDIESGVMRCITSDPEKWNSWLTTHPMTDEQRTLAKIYLTCAGIDFPETIIDKDKAYRLCAQSQREPQYAQYQTFLRYGIGKFESHSVNVSAGYQFAWYSKDIFKYLNSNHLSYFSVSFREGRAYVGLNINFALSPKYKGDTTFFATYNDQFAIADGQKTRYTQMLLELGARIGLPRRISWYGVAEFGGHRLTYTERSKENGRTKSVNHVIKPLALVVGGALKTDIKLAEWKHQKFLVPDMGLSLNFSVGTRLTKDDAMLWASAGLTLFMY